MERGKSYPFLSVAEQKAIASQREPPLFPVTTAISGKLHRARHPPRDFIGAALVK